jgi:polysaccharide biosynthesis/export protein
MLRLFTVLLVSLLLSACSSTPAGMIVATGERYAPPAEASEGENYRLDAGDKIRLTVFNESTLSGEFAVGSDGKLSLPLIGDVIATGRTTRQIAAEVQTRLADGYLREPRISMEVVSYRPFFILGEVKSPGQYPYATSMTVLNAVATAQGFTPRAAQGHVFIRRAGESAEITYRVTPNLRVYPGDTVRFGERYF